MHAIALASLFIASTARSAVRALALRGASAAWREVSLDQVYIVKTIFPKPAFDVM